MNKANTIFGHKNKEKWRPKAPEPKVIKRSTQSIINATINQTIDKKKIDVIITSVNYNDFLILSLENNTKYFENITVVTSNDDIICQNICKSYGVKCITTDVFYEDGFKFNKGKAINVGIESLTNPEFILILDADIIVTNKIELTNLESDTLYTSDRWICYNHFQYEKWKKGETPVNNLPKYERDNGYGFFQLFNFNNTMESKWYPSELENSSHPDLKFSSYFPKKQTISVDIIHLGDVKKNWNGRTSENFITDNLFTEILNNIKKIVIYKEKNLIDLLNNIKHESNNLNFDLNFDEKSKDVFIIHVSSIYRAKDDDSIRRNEFAQKTWLSFYESGNVIPAMVYDDNDELPKIKDIFEWGYKFCKSDDDIILYTNSDICITEDAYNKILESCKRYQCTFSFRKDFGKLEEIKTPSEVSKSLFSNGSRNPEGADIFAVTKRWWLEWRDYLPDNQTIGRPTWDWIFRITMGVSLEGDITFRKKFEDQGRVCETPNISYHETHESFWNRSLLEKSNISNTKIAYDWMIEKSNNKFTGKKYFEKTYGEYIK
jgi:hypothetical protein